MTKKGERQNQYAQKPDKLTRIAKRLNVSAEELREAILAESPTIPKSGVVTLTFRVTSRL